MNLRDFSFIFTCRHPQLFACLYFLYFLLAVILLLETHVAHQQPPVDHPNERCAQRAGELGICVCKAKFGANTAGNCVPTSELDHLEQHDDATADLMEKNAHVVDSGEAHFIALFVALLVTLAAVAFVAISAFLYLRWRRMKKQRKQL